MSNNADPAERNRNLSNMKPSVPLIIIKIIHTLVWLFFNAVLAYLVFAISHNKIDKWIWIGLGSFLLEGMLLLIFKNTCPLTILARRYSDSIEDNFDIYLPNWLAKYNKIIYTSLLLVIIFMLIYRLVTNNQA